MKENDLLDDKSTGILIFCKQRYNYMT